MYAINVNENFGFLRKSYARTRERSFLEKNEFHFNLVNLSYFNQVRRIQYLRSQGMAKRKQTTKLKHSTMISIVYPVVEDEQISPRSYHINPWYSIPQVRGYNPLHPGTVGVARVQIQEELMGNLRPQKRLKKGKMSPAAQCGQLARFEVLIMTGEYR
jgi:hypothetical protein